jgi:hypothetical protein
MLNELQPRYAAVSQAIPTALVVWKMGTRLMAAAQKNPAARTWARIGLAGAALVAVAVVGVGLADRRQQAVSAEQDERLDEELMDSFPASDAPAMTRAGG